MGKQDLVVSLSPLGGTTANVIVAGHIVGKVWRPTPDGQWRLEGGLTELLGVPDIEHGDFYLFSQFVVAAFRSAFNEGRLTIDPVSGKLARAPETPPVKYAVIVDAMRGEVEGRDEEAAVDQAHEDIHTEWDIGDALDVLPIEEWEQRCPSVSFKMVSGRGYDGFAVLINGEEQDNRGEMHGSIRWDYDEREWVQRKSWRKTKWERSCFGSLDPAMGSLVMEVRNGFYEGTLKMDWDDQRIVNVEKQEGGDG